MAIVAFSACLVLVATVGCSADHNVAVANDKGAVSAIQNQGDYVSIRVNARIPERGWGNIVSLHDAKNVKFTRGEGTQNWTGRIEVQPGKTVTYEQTISEVDGGLVFDVSLTAEADADTEGIFFWIDAPIELLKGGTAALTDGESAPMPMERPEQRHFISGQAPGLTLTSADEATEIAMTFDRAVPVIVQDTREWNGSDYSAFMRIADSVEAGETTTFRVAMQVRTEQDDTPANLAVDASDVGYKLHGFGGNYCFNIESPISQYTLANLRQGWARTEVTAYEWEPENDNDDPNDTNWDYLRAQDKPDSNLRREFLIAKQIQDKGIPYCASVWGMPGWMYSEPIDRPRGSRRKIADDKWDELLECLGSYFVHARDEHGVEPDLFSFNEANIGVDVWLTAEEHRDAIKRIGAHFEKLGLKTKMLLADATGPRGTHVYAEPAANDPEALKYCAAIGFHSWGGASPEEYAAWGDLAERLGLPLLVAELGVDAGAWRTNAFDTYLYALREVEMYQELLLYARPQGTQQWEFTADYGICDVEKDADGNETVVPTVRYHFVE
ncbi:MAG TPA: hypothetical protein QGH10_21140, partial [Armatimonadota bacterium]|nr:hypothetical protein [Armatimonadota bacterium]